MINIAAITIFKLGLAAGVAAAIVFDDLRHRRISNLLCAALLLIGTLSSGFSQGWRGMADGLLGAAVGFVVFLIPYGLGGLGGGDVKLMAGCGALTGTQGILPALLLVSAAGAATSIMCLLWSRMRGKVAPAAIPYAPAIVAGSFVVALSEAAFSQVALSQIGAR